MTKMSLTIVKIAVFKDSETETLNGFPVFIAVFLTEKPTGVFKIIHKSRWANVLDTDDIVKIYQLNYTLSSFRLNTVTTVRLSR